MENEELKNFDPEDSQPKANNSAHVVTADSVQAEQVPTIPLGSLQTINALRPEVSVHSIASTPIVSMPEPLVVQPAEYRRSLDEWFHIWWDGIRPAYFSLSLMPALLGSVLAWTQTITTRTPLGRFHFTHFLFTIVALFLLQVGANLVNDYYDYLRGVDRMNALGPGGLIQQGLVKPTFVLKCGLILLGLGAFLGVIVAAAGGPLVYVYGLMGLLCAFFFSATQRSLSALALGELVGFCIFGPLITLGAYMVQVGYASPLPLVYSLSLGLLAAAVIHVNNMRDLEGDEIVGKHTLASIIGLQWSRAWFLVLLLGAYAVVVAMGLPHGAPHLLLITLWTLPLLVVIITGILRSSTPASLHMVMHQTLRLEIYFTVLLMAALIVSAVLPVLPRIPLNILPV